MSDTEKNSGGLKKKIVHEMGEYLINVCYLTLVFAAFTQYRRILLDAHEIVYTNYGVAVIEGLILGKVIMIGEVFRLGRGLERKPLIYPTLYKTFAFLVFVDVFKLIEHGIKGVWNGNDFMAGLIDYAVNDWHEVLANNLIIFVAFIPFFAVKELGRVLGKKKVKELFFRSGVSSE